jgi:tetratricopeptide (TPR) repeat protein
VFTTNVFPVFRSKQQDCLATIRSLLSQIITKKIMSHEFINGNQRAVALLQNGERDQAIAFFSGALLGIRQCVESAGQADQQDTACRRYPTRSLHYEEQGTEDENSRGTNNLIISLALGGCYELAESQTATPDNTFSFYNHAFVFGNLPEITTRTSQEETHHDTMISAVLIFNLALSFYGKGLCADGPKSPKYLRKALHLYSMAISLINDETGFEELHALELASWNNIGYIYSHFSEHENAMKCRVHLYQTLFAAPDTSLRLTYGYSYSLFYLFVVSSEVRRREMRLSLAA